jgi:hypothetical protein
VKLKLTICARAGDRAGLFCVRDPSPRAALDAQAGDSQMTFVKGQSGNPTGWPPGSRNKATTLAETAPAACSFSCSLQE